MEVQSKILRDEYRYALLPLVRPDARVFTFNEARAILGVSRNTLLNKLASGELRGYKDTIGGRWKITEPALAEYVQARMKQRP